MSISNGIKQRPIGMMVLVGFILVGIGYGVYHRLHDGAAAGPVQQPPVEVKVMQVIQRDTPLTYEFVGQVQAKNAIQIRAKVSGNIVAKMVAGGASVHKGDVLFQLDSRQYNSALAAAQAQLAQSQAALSNAQLDADRYQRLAAQSAIAQQTADTAAAAATQNTAVVEANAAKVESAREDLADTVITAPIDGRIDINDLSSGSFVQAGQSVLATISSVDPVFVQFSVSENEYLHLRKLHGGDALTTWGNVKLFLSDGSEYPLSGKVDQVDNGLAQNTGTIAMKASFDNPQRLLVPGMFARLVVQGEVRKGALLVPQRAVQQVLDKTLITVLTGDNQTETRPVKLGVKIGNLWMVEEGLSPGDRVVVEGAAKLQPKVPFRVSVIQPEDLQTPAKP